MLAGWLRKLEPLGHGNPEPLFLARNARLIKAPRIMKARHLALELAQDSISSPNANSNGLPVSATPQSTIRAVGWSLAERAMELHLEQGSHIDVAYRIHENDHPDFGGLEIEMMALRLAELELRAT